MINSGKTMFSNLSDSLTKIFDKLRGKGYISEDDINLSMREIRVALLDADVSLPIAKDFINKVKEKALGAEIIKSIKPGQQIIKLVSDELEAILGSENQELNIKTKPPAVIVLVGLQGSGKTTTAAKLALKLKQNNKKKILLASLDTYRPAAQMQLETLGKQIAIDTVAIIESQKPLEITKRALNQAKDNLYDVLILDTAGRLHTDEDLITELVQIKSAAEPIETILVVDSLTGQDAVNIGKEFNDRVGITGVILTRVDGDARGGAALSMRNSTNCPIKFIGVGEKPNDLEEFHPKRIASQILGMGDVVSLVEKAAEIINEEEAAKLSDKLQKGVFNMNDLRSQLKNIGKMGGLSKIMGFIPGVNKFKDQISQAGFSQKSIEHQIAIINSMTESERRNPSILNANRKKRIAAGSGTKVEDINKLVKQFLTMSTMMKKFGKITPNELEKMQRMMNVKY